MSAQTYTSLGSLKIYDPNRRDGHLSAATSRPSTTPGRWWATPHAGQHVARRDLAKRDHHGPETRYASILPAGFTLNNATAIDNNGDIAGYGTDSASNTYQAFVIYTLFPSRARWRCAGGPRRPAGLCLAEKEVTTGNPSLERTTPLSPLGEGPGVRADRTAGEQMPHPNPLPKGEGTKKV